MRTVRISDAVWEQIADRGQFGESVDDVLRRVFGIEPNESSQHDTGSAAPRRQMNGRSRNKATNRMSANVTLNRLVVEFASGEREEYKLPAKTDKQGIRKVRDEACEFAERIGATLGQVNAVKKALTDEGYYVSR